MRTTGSYVQFSSDNRPQAIHEALIKTHYGEKIAGHISRDATAIHAREKATAKLQEKTASNLGTESKGGKRGRRRKDDPPAPPPEPKRLQQQLERDLEANLADFDSEFSPTEAVRYRERSAVERVNSHLHEQHGGRHVHVRGPVKVAAHLAFGLVVIAAEQMLRMLG